MCTEAYSILISSMLLAPIIIHSTSLHPPSIQRRTKNLVSMFFIEYHPLTEHATACFSCSPPDLNFLVIYFIYMYMHNDHCHQVTAQLQLINIIIIIINPNSHHTAHLTQYSTFMTAQQLAFKRERILHGY